MTKAIKAIADLEDDDDGEDMAIRVSYGAVLDAVLYQTSKLDGNSVGDLYVMSELVHRTTLAFLQKLAVEGGDQIRTPPGMAEQLDHYSNDIADKLYELELAGRKALVERLGGTWAGTPAAKSETVVPTTTPDFDLADFNPKGKGN